eukprot:3360418-Rhodomonas_salina.1
MSGTETQHPPRAGGADRRRHSAGARVGRTWSTWTRETSTTCRARRGLSRWWGWTRARWSKGCGSSCATTTGSGT